MSDSITVTLAGTAYTVPRLTVRQLRDLQIGSVEYKPDELPTLGKKIEAAYDSDIQIISVGLRRNYPEMTVDAIYDLETNRDEINTASLAILIHSGLVKPTGEASAPSPETE